MAYTNLINDIKAVIRNNGNQEITGQILQTALVEMVNELGSGYTYKGVATLSTNPDTTTPNIFYLLGDIGTYTNIGSIQHQSGIGIAVWDGTNWSYQHMSTNEMIAFSDTGTIEKITSIMFNGTKFVSVSASYWVSYFVADTDCTIDATFSRVSTYTHSGKICIVDSEDDIVVGQTATQLYQVAVNETYTHSYYLKKGQCLCISARSGDTMDVTITGRDIVSVVTPMPSQIKAIQEDLPTRIPYEVIDASQLSTRDGYYINYDRGTMVHGSTAANFVIYHTPISSGARIIARLGSYDSAPAAIAFFSSEYAFINGNAGTVGAYMKDDSVQAISGVNDYDVIVPYGARYVAICNRGSYIASPTITIYQPSIVQDNIDTTMRGAKNTKALPLCSCEPHYYHFRPNDFLQDASGNNIIGSQSLFDIEIASRLGFKFIEGNIKQTSDGKFIVTHGVSGKYGSEFCSIDETQITTSDLQNTLFENLSLSFLQSYVRYDSTIEKYRTAPSTLEDFCKMCKKNNIGLMAGVLGSKEAVEICQHYMGENMVVYGPPMDIRDYYSGYVLLYNNAAGLTENDIFERCAVYGKPLIYILGSNTIDEFMASGTLDTLIENFHKNGYEVGLAGVYQTEAETRMCLEMGMDCNASGHEVNPFEYNYEYYDIEDANHRPTTNGTFADGVITLTTGNTLTCGSADVIPLGKGELRLRFNGAVTIKFGSQSSRTLTSSGENDIVISDYFFRRDTQLTITATASTIVYNIVYKTSKC